MQVRDIPIVLLPTLSAAAQTCPEMKMMGRKGPQHDTEREADLCRLLKGAAGLDEDGLIL